MPIKKATKHEINTEDVQISGILHCLQKAVQRSDWAHAEVLAFATINQDGTPIRLTGQDSERGTFAQRHAVLHDPETGEEHVPLHEVSNSNATFDVHNSPLSEAAVVGFDYGYNVERKDVLAIWEAQYGDFSNMAQVMFDNFMAAGNAKWGETSGMTLFLPHAQEGQGARALLSTTGTGTDLSFPIRNRSRKITGGRIMAEVKVPELAESITEGTIASWLKQKGDRVEKGENILELETDKVNVEVISEEAGVITELKAEEGDTVEVGQVIAIVEDNGEAGGSIHAASSEARMSTIILKYPKVQQCSQHSTKWI